MKPTIAVDANPIISALIGGFSREVLFNHHFEFIITPFTVLEVQKFIPYIAEKAGVSVELVKWLFDLLPLKVCPLEEYEEKIPEAKVLVKDPKDVDILALALAKNCPLWSNDQHFDGIKEIKLVRTKDFV